MCHVRISFAVTATIPPIPLEFMSASVGDTMMQCTTRKLPDGTLRPFYLLPDAYKQLQDFVSEAPASETPQVLVLTGPVKCGKTTVLHHVLPSIIADAYRHKKTPEPVILRFTFDLKTRPADAALSLLEAAKKIASAKGLPLELEYQPGWALRNLDSSLGTLAFYLKRNGAQLWLLLDECQVRTNKKLCCAALSCTLFSEASDWY